MKFCLTKLVNRLIILTCLAAVSSGVFAQTVKIGWLSSLTGPLSSAAVAENQGVQLAVEEINKAGGILGKQIELLTRDTAGDPTKAVNFAQQLAFSDKVQFVIGPVNSGEGLATTPILARAGVPNIVIGSIDELTDATKYPRAFRAINTNRQWISTANNYALDTLKKTKVAIIADTSGYGTASAKTAQELLEKVGIKPVYKVLVDPNKTDLSDEMSKARAAGADVVMPWSAATGLLARLLNARGDMGWNVPVVGHPALMASQIRQLLNKPQYWENTFASGYLSTTYGTDGKLPELTQALADKMRPRLGGGEIDVLFWWVAMGYDTVKIIEHAAKTAGSTEPAAIQKALENTKDFHGVYANYTWSPTQRNGFPDSNMVTNAANTFKDGSFRLAPR
ncbi:MAG TPA: ABC transporter substrate-binding protein [Polaromonas sp.]|uniref:ABC transporter substrate-binding protein n=1 Tax=Polaromonas sp. UBA4122 TaxID=1947074 RepID=UPI000EC29059|nr:ABC transporter substrate-binding protein [Polaromonas sp. UBA4122]HAL38320.1 ABC transporter substrate-binding protein [Polaromonas sp.]